MLSARWSPTGPTQLFLENEHVWMPYYIGMTNLIDTRQTILCGAPVLKEILSVTLGTRFSIIITSPIPILYQFLCCLFYTISIFQISKSLYSIMLKLCCIKRTLKTETVSKISNTKTQGRIFRKIWLLSYNQKLGVLRKPHKNRHVFWLKSGQNLAKEQS